MTSTAADYVHEPLEQRVRAIGGYYAFTHEACLRLGGRTVLYRVGLAVFDTTCCGFGGCAYASVPGFVRRWHYRSTRQGLPVSRVEPIRARRLQQEVRRHIAAREAVSQVCFD